MTASRRQTIRIHCDLPAAWQRSGNVGRGRVLDMSARGLLLAGATGFVIGEQVEIVVEIAGGAVKLTGEVRFVGATRHGAGAGLAIVAAEAGWHASYRALADHAIASAPSRVARYLRARTGG